MNKLTLLIKAGNKYVRRDGVCVIIQKLKTNAQYEIIAHPTNYPSPNMEYNDTVYADTGKFFLFGDYKADLVADYVETVETFLVGDLIQTKRNSAHYYYKDTFARLTKKDGNGTWWADFKDCGNTLESWNESCGGIWCIGEESPDNFVHAAPSVVAEKVVAHVHAANMLLYAQDANETDTPGKLWEYSTTQGKYWKVIDHEHPIWANNLQYRRKPPAPKLIFINGHQVPEPMRVAPEIGTTYFTPCLSDQFAFTTYRGWRGSSQDIYRLEQGTCHLTREAAELHATALLSFTQIK